MMRWDRPTLQLCRYCSHRAHPAPKLCGLPAAFTKKPCLCRAMPKIGDEPKKPERPNTWDGSDDRD